MNEADFPITEGMKRFFRARKKMNAPEVISHITQRAAGSDIIFLEDDDYLEMLRRLKEVSQTFEIDILSFVLMPNHVHLLISQKQPNLNHAMRELFSRYARRHNVKYERKGHLFGGAYRQAVCLDEGYLLAVSLYIHLNPVRAGLVKRPEDYRWSSYGVFGDQKVPDSFITTDKILHLISSDLQQARKKYLEMIQEGVKIKSGEILEDSEAIHRFRYRLFEKMPLKRKKNYKNKLVDPVSKQFSMADNEDWIKIISSFAVGQVKQLPKDVDARRYLIKQLLYRGYTRKEIAKKLGYSPKTIYNVLKTY